MPIDKAGPAAGLIAALRSEMSQRKERTASSGTRETRDPAPIASARDSKVLRKQLADLVAPVSIDDPAAVRAVRPQIVRAILLWEFGAALRDHAEWQPMLESITSNLEASFEHEAQLLALISELKR
jgi:hypothetical protein